MKRGIRDRAGFTLLEVLVAMTILMIIVMMMAGIFHQSSTAWNNGLRQAEMSIQARSAMSLMRRDLSQAVAAPEYPCKFSANGFEVYVLGTTTGDVRSVHKVSYYGNLSRSSEEYEPSTGGGYFGPGVSVSGPLLDHVDLFRVEPAPGWSSTNLPRYVDIKLTLSKKTIGAAGIRVWSNGRDHIFDTDDDRDKRLRTWR